MNLYIDVLFAVNVWMNMGLLALTGSWVKCKRRMFFLFLGAAAGGAFSCFLAVFPVFPRWVELLAAYALAGPVMCRIAFGKRELRMLFRETISFSVIAIFIGGLLNQLYFHTGAGYVMRELLTGRSAKGGGLPVLFLLAAASFLAGKEVIFFFGTAKKNRETLFRIVLKKGDRSVEATALLDTGNRLYEPITGKPVSIGERNVFLSLFPEEEDETEGFFLIPYRSIGGEGFLKGRCLSEMAVIGEDGSENPFPDAPFLVALKEGALSGNGAYQLILHGDFAEYTASLKKRRKRHGDQGGGSQPVSVKNYLQHERTFVFKEKRGPLHWGKRCASGAAFCRDRSGDDREAGDGRGKRGESGSD